MPMLPTIRLARNEAVEVQVNGHRVTIGLSQHGLGYVRTHALLDRQPLGRGAREQVFYIRSRDRRPDVLQHIQSVHTIEPSVDAGTIPSDDGWSNDAPR